MAFFLGWVTWQQVAFILAGLMFLVFVNAHAMRFVRRRRVNRARRARQENDIELRDLGATTSTVPPFGRKALEEGPEVPGIWHSRPNTPLPSSFYPSGSRGRSTESSLANYAESLERNDVLRRVWTNPQHHASASQVSISSWDHPSLRAQSIVPLPTTRLPAEPHEPSSSNIQSNHTSNGPNIYPTPATNSPTSANAWSEYNLRGSSSDSGATRHGLSLVTSVPSDQVSDPTRASRDCDRSLLGTTSPVITLNDSSHAAIMHDYEPQARRNTAAEATARPFSIGNL